MINEEEKYRRLKEDIRMMRAQINYTRKDESVEEGRKLKIEFMINSLTEMLELQNFGQRAICTI